MRVAIYARVSTKDQDCSMQLTELRGYVHRNGWEGVEYLDKASGKEGAQRPEQRRLMADARLRKFDAVLVWKLDRWGRSLRHLVDSVDQLNGWGLRFIAIHDGIDTDKKSPMATLIFQIFAALAEFERALIQERVNAGIQEHKRAVRQGEIGKVRHTRSGKDLPIGRQRRIFDRDEAVRLRKLGLSVRVIARKLGVSIGTAHAATKGVQQT